MTKRTNTILGIAATYFVGLAVTLGGTLYLIHKQGTRLDTSQIAIAEHVAKEAAYTNVMQLLDSTMADRQTLATYFITEKSTIIFITELETIAARLGVTFETTALSVQPAVTKDSVTTPALLLVGVSFKGNEPAVKEFITVLENIPYHSTMSSLTLTQTGAHGQWQAKSALRITIQS